jgi:hypothetical protein
MAGTQEDLELEQVSGLDERQRDRETEARITGKNQHSVYRLCPAHGFGIHGPGEDTCPDCGDPCILYLSGEDVRQVVKWDDFAALRASNERLREVVALLNSMVLSGEDHSDDSQRLMRNALAAPW